MSESLILYKITFDHAVSHVCSSCCHGMTNKWIGSLIWVWWSRVLRVVRYEHSFPTSLFRIWKRTLLNLTCFPASVAIKKMPLWNFPSFLSRHSFQPFLVSVGRNQKYRAQHIQIKFNIYCFVIFCSSHSADVLTYITATSHVVFSGIPKGG